MWKKSKLAVFAEVEGRVSALQSHAQRATLLDGIEQILRLRVSRRSKQAGGHNQTFPNLAAFHDQYPQ